MQQWGKFFKDLGTEQRIKHFFVLGRDIKNLLYEYELY